MMPPVSNTSLVLFQELGILYEEIWNMEWNISIITVIPRLIGIRPC